MCNMATTLTAPTANKIKKRQRRFLRRKMTKWTRPDAWLPSLGAVTLQKLYSPVDVDAQALALGHTDDAYISDFAALSLERKNGDRRHTEKSHTRGEKRFGFPEIVSPDWGVDGDGWRCNTGSR